MYLIAILFAKKQVFFSFFFVVVNFTIYQGVKVSQMRKACTHFLTSHSCLLISKWVFLLYFALVFMHRYQVAPVHEL